MLENLLITNIITATTTTTKKIPTPIPALKISPMAEQLENKKEIIKRNAHFFNRLFMM
ncbi:MAG: hypothetical protein H7239_14280 [Flavobacterium sp.]|nr:hypothetical protein [Flavobacterium sp.]